MRNHILLMLILAAGLSACNKDDIIDINPEIPSTPTSPDTPDTPDSPGYEPGAAGGLLVYEYTPAPGQFINEFTDDISAAEAAQWAATRLAEGKYVSLGAFGGYITVGFGRHIGDFVITGNAFTNTGGSSNEPGIVYVMQDVNGNGLPDDEWYELRGSETGDPATLQDYAVTYYRPESPKSHVRWTDSLGAEGEIDYMGTFHRQDYYYPAWITTDSYTLRGTRLRDNSGINDINQWFTAPFAYGYVDNTGSNDDVFHISDAMSSDLSPVSLGYIDFIRIQTGVCGKCGILGEISTEVTGIHEL